MSSETVGAEKPAKKRGLFHSTAVVGAGTLSSRVLGLVRDIVIGHIFGAGGGVDAFLIAFKIPNFLRRLFAEGAFAQAFVPVLAETKEKEGKEAVKDLLAHISAWLGTWLFAVTAIMILFAPYVAIVFAPGFLFHDDPVKLAQTAETIRWVAPYLFFISLTALSSSVLNTFGSFGVPAVTPVFLNISLIGFALFGAPYFANGIDSLSLGVFVAGIVQFSFQLPFIRQQGLLVRPRFRFSHPGVKKVAKLMVPALVGVSVSQINLLLDTVLASLLRDGSVSWLYYSDRLSELPLGLIGIAIATVVLPSLSSLHASDNREKFQATLIWAIKMVMLLGLPASCALFFLAEPLIATIFFHGEMDYFSVHMASLSLKAYASGLLAFMLIKILAPGFYARQDMKSPVRIAIAAMVLNMVFNVILVFHFKHVGLAAATAISAWFNAISLYVLLGRKIGLVADRSLVRFVLQALAASVVMLLVLYWLSPEAGFWEHSTVIERILHLSLQVFSGIFAFFAAFVLAGGRPRHLKR